MDRFSWKAIVVTIAAAALLLVAVLARYELNAGSALKLDRWTGAVYVLGDHEELIPREREPPNPDDYFGPVNPASGPR